MRRVSPTSAQLGMILARAVYDGRGTQLLDTGTVLDARHLPVLARLELKDLLVHDSRVDDVLIEPLISEQVEAQAIRQLHRIMDNNRDRRIEHIKIDMEQVNRVIKAMIQSLYSAFMGELDIEGSMSLGNYDYIHPVKVAGLSLLMGKEAGYSRSDLVSLGTAAYLMNIGYSLLPHNIIITQDPLSEETPKHIRKHVVLGNQIISQCAGHDPKVAEAILQHHERWAGNGYPNGLKGKAIGPFARIIAIADTYHALVSLRPGQQPYSPPEAAEYIAAYSGELFDPELVQLFFRKIPFYPRGISVRLNTGEVGIVTNPNIGYIGRPVVRVCYGRDGLDIEKPYDITLSDLKHQDKVIAEIVEY